MQTGPGQNLPPFADSSLPRQLEGIFAYLSATLSAQDLETARTHDPAAERSRFLWDCPRKKIADHILYSFRLQYSEGPFRNWMASFRLYFRDDMADALAVAFLLYYQGKNPIPALTADYTVPSCGILTWVSLEEQKSKAKNNSLIRSRWDRISPLLQEGDRLARYSRYTSSGWILVRGDRRVWQEEHYHLSFDGPSLRFRRNMEKFESLGGNRAFLAGDFDWPPPNWTNPTTDDEEEAYFKANHFQSESLWAKILGATVTEP